MTRLALLLWTATVFAGCATTSQWDGNVDLRNAGLESLSKRFPDAHGVVLLREDRYENRPGQSMQQTHHEALRFFTERSLSYGRVVIHLDENDKLVNFAARTLTRDGRYIPYDLDQLIVQHSTTVDNDGDSKNITTVIAKFPRLQTGGGIEYTYTIDHDGGWWGFTRTVSGPFPILRYKLDLLTSTKRGHLFRVYNNDAPLQASREGFMHHYTLRLKDLPASEDESYSPDTSLRDVWFRYRINDQKTQAWANALWWPGKLLIDDKRNLRSLFGPRLKLSDGETQACRQTSMPETCRLQTLLKGLNAHVAPTTAGRWWKLRPVAAILKSKRGTGIERNLVLYDALRKEGIAVKWVLATRRLSQAVDYDFASSDWFNYALLEVKADQQTHYVDGGCAHCSLGELPHALVNQRGARMTERVATQFRVAGKWVKLRGKATPVPQMRDTYDVVLDEHGVATVEMKRIYTSDLAQRRAAKVRDDDADGRKRRARSMARGVSSDAVDVKSLHQACTLRPARCETRISFRVPGYGERHGDELVAPAHEFAEHRTPSTGALDDDDRVGDLFFTRSEAQQQLWRLHLPAGATVDVDVKSKSGGDDNLRYSCSLDKDHDAIEVQNRLLRRAGRYGTAERKAMAQTLYDYRACLRDLLTVKLPPKKAPAQTPAASSSTSSTSSPNAVPAVWADDAPEATTGRP